MASQLKVLWLSLLISTLPKYNSGMISQLQKVSRLTLLLFILSNY